MVSPPTLQRHELAKSIHATFLHPTARGVQNNSVLTTPFKPRLASAHATRTHFFSGWSIRNSLRSNNSQPSRGVQPTHNPTFTTVRLHPSHPQFEEHITCILCEITFTVLEVKCYVDQQSEADFCYIRHSIRDSKQIKDSTAFATRNSRSTAFFQPSSTRLS